ncbi:MAG TPA: hypothetical protein VHZ95_07745, partial [Polyangiales bacterium]|nr:hypothetical protein [Polyangiales bacterium]
PLLALPAIDLFDRPSKLRLAAVSGIALLGFYVQLLGICVDPGRFLQLVRPVTQAVDGRYDPDRLRDDLLPIHFVPELNPILGQQWLLGRYLTRPPWKADSDYPWRSLGIPNWRPLENPTPKRLDFWLDARSSPGALSLELLLAISTLWLAAALARELAQQCPTAALAAATPHQRD